MLSLSKLADIPITKHREIPDEVTLKEVTIKKESTGEWYACFVVDGKQTPEKPADPERCVGIDVGILKYAHDTDGTAVESLDLSAERERLERAQRDLSRKEHGANNWEKQRKIVAQRHADLKRKRRDFLHKLSAYYAREYEPRSRRGSRHEGASRTTGELSKPSVGSVGDVQANARIQVRPRRHALCGGRPKGYDQRVRQLWREN